MTASGDTLPGLMSRPNDRTKVTLSDAEPD